MKSVILIDDHYLTVSLSLLGLTCSYSKFLESCHARCTVDICETHL